MVLPTGVNLQVVKFKLLGWMYTYVVVQTLNTFFLSCYMFNGTWKMQENPVPTQHRAMTLAELNKAD